MSSKKWLAFLTAQKVGKEEKQQENHLPDEVQTEDLPTAASVP